MPSPSSNPPSSSVMVSLPSIHEMFPEHLMKLPPALRLSIASMNSTTATAPAQAPHPKAPHSRTNLPAQRSPSERSSPSPFSALSRRADGVVSFDVWRSDPSLPTLQHIASSNTLPNRASNVPGPSRSVDIAKGSAPAFRVNPSASSSTSGQEHSSVNPTIHPRYSPTMRVSEAPNATVSASEFRYSSEDLSDEGDDKKHICTTCHKRFNRPSSLRIHMNTHTGATPFRCPYPNCGREFNVNSNMRRHYRNHGSSVTRSQGNDDPSSPNVSTPRRRQRRVDSSSGTRISSSDRDFLVLRPHAETSTSGHSGFTEPCTGASSRSRPHSSSAPTDSWPPTQYGKIRPSLSGDSDIETESTIDDEDELMDDDTTTHHSRNLSPVRRDGSTPSLYRLQPVSDFSDRYSNSTSARYHPQSDVRSLPPPTPLLSSASSSSSSPPASPSSSFNSPTSWSTSGSYEARNILGTKTDSFTRHSLRPRWP